MAVLKVPKRAAVSLKINTGTVSDVVLKSVSMGGIKPEADEEQVMDVADLLAPILAYPVTAVEQSATWSLERDG